MGLRSEDVMHCLKCENLIVYEPTIGIEQVVECYSKDGCRAKHTVLHPVVEIKLVDSEPEPVPDNGKRVYVEPVTTITPHLLMLGGTNAGAKDIIKYSTSELLMGRVLLDGGNPRDYAVEWKPLARLGIDERFLALAIRKPLKFEDVYNEVADILQGAGSIEKAD